MVTKPGHYVLERTDGVAVYVSEADWSAVKPRDGEARDWAYLLDRQSPELLRALALETEVKHFLSDDHKLAVGAGVLYPGAMIRAPSEELPVDEGDDEEVVY